MANVPIVTEVTKAQLDALVAANGLNEGLQYKVTDKEWLVTAISSRSYIKSIGYDNNLVKCFYVQIPIISVGERIVIQQNLGDLINPNRCAVGFFKYEVSELDSTIIEAGLKAPNNVGVIYPLLTGNQCFVIPKNISDNFDFRLTDAILSNMLFVTKDYTKAMRLVSPLGSDVSSTEKYDTNSILPAGITYEQIGAGVLVGWYAYSNYNALVMKKIQIESAWLSDSGTNSVLNIAIKNVDSTDTTAQKITLAIYE